MLNGNWEGVHLLLTIAIFTPILRLPISPSGVFRRTSHTGDHRSAAAADDNLGGPSVSLFQLFSSPSRNQRPVTVLNRFATTLICSHAVLGTVPRGRRSIHEAKKTRTPTTIISPFSRHTPFTTVWPPTTEGIARGFSGTFSDHGVESELEEKTKIRFEKGVA